FAGCGRAHGRRSFFRNRFILSPEVRYRCRRSAGVTRKLSPLCAAISNRCANCGTTVTKKMRDRMRKTRRTRPLTNLHPSPRLSPEPAKHLHSFAFNRRKFLMAGKADVINAIAEQAGISKKEASAAFDAF